MAREKLCVGVDIGCSCVKLCKVKAGRRGLSLESFGMMELPSETVVDGALMNPSRVVDALTELVASLKLRHRQVALSISGHSVIIKKISLPSMSREELEKSIQWEAEQYIPFDIADVFLDVQIVNVMSAQQGQMDVVLVAAKKDFVNEYTSVVIEAGLEPVVCDVDAFAIETMFATNYGISPDNTVVLVNVGASKTNINIIAQGGSVFTRDLTIGGNTFTEEIQKQLNVSAEEAESLKLGIDAGGARGGAASAGLAVEAVAQTMTTEIQRSIDFYSASSADPAPSRLYLMGGASRQGALRRGLEARIGVPVVIADPFLRIAPSRHDPAFLQEVGPAAAVVVGLALRYPGDA